MFSIRRSLAVLVSALSLAHVGSNASTARERTLIDPATILDTAKRVDFVGTTDFKLEQTPFGPGLRSIPHNSASGLYQSVDMDSQSLSHLQWRWRVDFLQASSDLRSLAREDAAATVFFVFGEPSVFNRDVPTIAYVWSATDVQDGSVFPSERYDSLRYVQLRGAASLGTWQTETRNVAEDYRRIFGREPNALKYVAYFVDNDQTGETSSALFGALTTGR